MSPRRKVEDKGTRLLSLWERPDDAGEPIGCVATTFTFDSAFFEEHCLGRFADMDSDPVEDQRAYLIEREEKFSQMFACVLVDRAHVTASRSLRWHLCPVTVPGGGILHSKVSLLVWRHRIRVIVSSANLTPSGYRMNFEQAGVLDFVPEGDIPLAMLTEVLDFLGRVRGLAAPDAVEQGPHRSLGQFLAQVRSQVKSWSGRPWGRGDVRAEWLFVEPGAASVFQQVQERMWSGPGPDQVQVLSPFFDRGAALPRTLDALHGFMGTYREREVLFQVAGTELPGGEYELNAPEGLRESGKRGLMHKFALVCPQDENGEPRPLHAKSLWLQREDRAVHTVGSSNFTSPGLGLGPGPINVEANLAYVLTSATSRSAWSQCDAATPKHELLDLGEDELRFLQEPLDHTPEPNEYSPLPASFGSALFEPHA